MKAIEIRLDPTLVESLLEAIAPSLESLENELAIPAEFPEDDELLEDFWKSDLLNAQREEIAVFASLFDDEFMESGRAVIEPEQMDQVLRGCSAIRLRLRETTLAPIQDSQLEEGDLDGLEWTNELRIAYAAYALFASLQEMIISQLSGGELDEDDENDDSRDWSSGEDSTE